MRSVHLIDNSHKISDSAEKKSDCLYFIFLCFDRLLDFNHEKETDSQFYFKKDKKEVHDIFL